MLEKFSVFLRKVVQKSKSKIEILIIKKIRVKSNYIIINKFNFLQIKACSMNNQSIWRDEKFVNFCTSYSQDHGLR